VAESCTILAAGGKSGNFWIHSRISQSYLLNLNHYVLTGLLFEGRRSDEDLSQEQRTDQHTDDSVWEEALTTLQSKLHLFCSKSAASVTEGIFK